MSVYQPPSFVPRDAAAMERVIRDYPFATLVTARAPEPQISHLPLLFHSAPEPNGVLIGHMARANPHWRQFADGPTMALFHGPHAYVSPSSYAEPERRSRPGTMPSFTSMLASSWWRIVRPRSPSCTRWSSASRSGRAAPWRLQLEGRELEAMVSAIVAFRLLIERVDTKLKLSQNRSVTDRQRVVAALRAEHTAEASATADWMQPYAGEV